MKTIEDLNQTVWYRLVKVSYLLLVISAWVIAISFALNNLDLVSRHSHYGVSWDIYALVGLAIVGVPILAWLLTGVFYYIAIGKFVLPFYRLRRKAHGEPRAMHTSWQWPVITIRALIKWVISLIVVGGLIWLGLANKMGLIDMLLTGVLIVMLYSMWNRNNELVAPWVRWLGWVAFALWILSKIWRASL